MVTKHFFGLSQHQHADPARRRAAVAELPPASDELAELLATDPAAEVRLAAASRCTNLRALAAAWKRDADPAVRAALASALSRVLAETGDSSEAAAFLGGEVPAL